MICNHGVDKYCKYIWPGSRKCKLDDAGRKRVCPLLRGGFL